MCCLRHAEHPARKRTSLAGLEQNLLIFGPPYILLKKKWEGLITTHDLTKLPCQEEKSHGNDIEEGGGI